VSTGKVLSRFPEEEARLRLMLPHLDGRDASYLGAVLDQHLRLDALVATFYSKLIKLRVSLILLIHPSNPLNEFFPIFFMQLLKAMIVFRSVPSEELVKRHPRDVDAVLLQVSLTFI
jgi:hypothetical protein